MRRPAKNIKGEFIIGRIRVKELEVSEVSYNGSEKKRKFGEVEYDVVAYDEDHGVFMVDEWYKNDIPQLIPKAFVEKITWYQDE